MSAQTTIRNCADVKTFFTRGDVGVQCYLQQFIAHLAMCDDCRRRILATLETKLPKIICVLAALAIREGQEGRAGEGSELLRDLANSL